MSQAALQLRYNLERTLSRGSVSPVEAAPPFVRASGIGDCARKQTYNAKVTQRTPWASASALMAMQGNWMEDGMANYLIHPGEEYNLFDQQRELAYYKGDELILKGHIDGLIQEDLGDVDSTTYLWEMKGMSAFRFHKLATTNSVEKSDYGYFLQVQTYMTLLNAEGTKVPACLFTVVAKDPSALNNVRRGTPPINPIYVEEIPWDPEMGEVMLTRAERLVSLMKNGELADRERNPFRDWDCSERFCNFYAECDPKRAMAVIPPPTRGGKRPGTGGYTHGTRRKSAAESNGGLASPEEDSD